MSDHKPDAATARIFEEIQELYGVSYVSAIHRQIAGWPGFLDWAWARVAPVFRSGEAQAAAKACGQGLELAPLAPIPAVALRAWGIDGAALAAVRAAAQSFVRVAPINMIFAGLIKAIIEGGTPGGEVGSAVQKAELPALLPPPPDMVDLAEADDVTRALALGFASDLDGQPFVPGLYRMIVRWPGLAAHLVTVLRPRLDEPEAMAAFDTLRCNIDAALPPLLRQLPTPSAMPRDEDGKRFLEVGQTYRKTSPELVVAGRLLEGALPVDLD